MHPQLSTIRLGSVLTTGEFDSSKYSICKDENRVAAQQGINSNFLALSDFERNRFCNGK